MTATLFWDIDGTLLTTARAGVFALEDAAREVLGVEPGLEDLHTSGLTDWQVAEESIRACGKTPDASTVKRFLEVYERELPGRLGLRQGRVMPMVREILDALAGRDDVACLLLTGNTRAGAAAKLAHYGLAGFFPDGAFCTEGDDRPAIAQRAWTLAGRSGGAPDPDRAYLIGDTPSDIAAGKAIGARTVAVATGTFTRSELGLHEPWIAVDELPPPADFARLIGLG